MRTHISPTAILNGTFVVFILSTSTYAAYQSRQIRPMKRLRQLYLSNNVSNKAKNHFENSNILLTGASGGLGRAIALQFASHFNINQMILTGRDEEKLQAVASECRSVSMKNKNDNDTQAQGTIDFITLPCDLSNLEDVRVLGENVASLPSPIDVFIHAGGLSSRSRFVDTDISIDQLLMNVNFLSGAMLSKFVVPGMVENGFGNIVWISSIQGLVGIPYRTSYAASKFAVQGYCEALRAELATSDVTVHVVSPGYIRTNLSQSAIMGNGSTYNKMDETTAKGADPQDVAVRVINSIADGRSELIVATTLSAKVALWLKFLAPSILRSMLVNRYDKQSKL